MSEKINLYAVLRVDEFDSVSGDEGITIKEILPTLEEAIQEVERLNKLRKKSGVTTFGGLAVISRKVDLELLQF